jgi:ribosome maturation factor RimP
MAVDLDQIHAIVERVAASSGLEVVELELCGGGKSRRLRIFIDKPAGVTHEDCAKLSREVSVIFDVEDAMPGGPYTLEVSSPGLDRKLSRPADFERFQGSRIKLMTKQPVQGNRHFEGRLEHFAAGRLTLDLADARKKFRPKQDPKHDQIEKLEIELANVEKANLVPEI